MYKIKKEINKTIWKDASMRSLFNLFDIFLRNNKQLYLVGGCVRDMLLGKEPKDFDLCTDAEPDLIKEICESNSLYTFDSGIKHGTLTIIDNFYKQQFEITVFRVDGKYTDGRHPDNISFTPSLEEDLKRRDFTINSFAYNLLTEELYALDSSFIKDLEQGIIRTVGNPEDRFNEDGLRMLRALRFSAQLNFIIDDDTYKAIEKCAPLLKYISKERIRDELTKILLSDNPQRLELFYTTGLEKYAFDNNHMPISEMITCEHQNPWHYTDVFHHTLDVVKNVPKNFVTRWAAFLHDVGKKSVKKLKEGTVDHYQYIGHQDASVEFASAFMDLLKFSNEQKVLISKYIKYHDKDLIECRSSKLKYIIWDIGVDNFPDFIKLKTADAMAHKLTKSTKYAITYPSKLYDRFNKIIEEKQPLSIRDLAINGFDLIDLGLRGKEIGDCLAVLTEAVLDNPKINTNEQLINLAKEFIINMKK